LTYYKKADELRNRAFFLSQVLEEKSRGYWEDLCACKVELLYIIIIV
jgi:hypothetical protein